MLDELEEATLLDELEALEELPGARLPKSDAEQGPGRPFAPTAATLYEYPPPATAVVSTIEVPLVVRNGFPEQSEWLVERYTL